MELREQKLTGERALFKASEMSISDSIFGEGESPLKESRSVEVTDSIFTWKYPFWYAKQVRVHESLLQEGARAGIWYSEDILVKNTTIAAPKTFRRSKNIALVDVDVPHADETLWMCDGVKLDQVSVQGHYFAMNSRNVEANDLRLVGNYSFDGCSNVRISRSRLISKDAFWNCDNVIVRDSFISGEYIGWNSRNVTFIDCTIESLQGLCYIDGLTLENCRLLNTSLAFEYCSDIDADIVTSVDSIKNPRSGTIRAASVKEIIFDDPTINPLNTSIITGELKHAV